MHPRRITQKTGRESASNTHSHTRKVPIFSDPLLPLLLPGLYHPFTHHKHTIWDQCCRGVDGKQQSGRKMHHSKKHGARGRRKTNATPGNTPERRRQEREREREGERTSGGNTFAQNAHDSRTLLADLAAESRLRNRAFIVHGRVGFLAIANFDAGYFILEAKSCSLCFSSLAPRYIDNWRLIQFPAGRAGFDSQLLL